MYTVAFGIALFGAGIAVGQRSSSSKFDKYLRPANRTEMDLIAQETGLQLLRDLMPMTDGISIPQVFFNYQTNQPQATVLIVPDLEKASLDDVKGKITERYYLTYFDLKTFMPELSEDDFVLRITRFTSDPQKKLFAECKHGNIVFH